MKLLTRSEELILWAILLLKDNAYCVPIRNRISEVTTEEWPLGSIYMPLDRLAKTGFLNSSLSDSTPERGGRRRRIYKLTREGLMALEKARAVQLKMWDQMLARWKES